MKPFTDEKIGQVALRSRALGDQTRVRILAVLSKGALPVGQIAEAAGTQQSTASKHLQVLFHAGLVRRRRDASTVVYWLSSPDLVEWCRYLGAPDLARRRARRVSSQRHAAIVAAERKAR